MKHRRIMTLLAVLMLGIGSVGCSPITRVVVIDQLDIVPLKQGTSFTPDRDGCFYSLAAEQSVMEAKRHRLNK